MREPAHAHRVSAERILVVDYRIPHFDRGGGDPRMDLILRTMAEVWPALSITLAVPCAQGAAAYSGRLRAAGVEVAPEPGDWAAWFESRRHRYGIVLVSRTREFEPLIRRTQPQALRVLDVEALFFRRLEQAALRSARPADREAAVRMREQEVEAIRGAEVIWCVSEEERTFVESVAPATPTCFVRYGAEPERASPGFASRQGIVFLGSFIAGVDSPNEDAALHLLADVMPRLWKDDADLTVRVVGADPTPKLMALGGGRVEVVGYQRDPRPFLARARVMVAPIRIGAGVKLKLIESMASGLPFVTTPLGAEGLGLGRLADDVVGRDEEAVATLTRRLYDDREHWEVVRLELASVYARLFTTERFRDDLIAAMSWAGVAPP